MVAVLNDPEQRSCQNQPNDPGSLSQCHLELLLYRGFRLWPLNADFRLRVAVHVNVDVNRRVRRRRILLIERILWQRSGSVCGPLNQVDDVIAPWRQVCAGSR